jgi:hypothetical protein
MTISDTDRRDDEAFAQGVPTQPARLEGEMWGITTYFNPAGYENRWAHLRLFAERVRRQGLKLLIVELAFDDAAPRLDCSIADRLVRVRSDSVLWQKERLLNIALEALPDSCDKIAWLDGDILFENEDWIGETSRLLETYVVVQPFHTAWYLPPGCVERPAEVEGSIMWGAAYALHARRKLDIGHPGLAWTARRAVLQRHGFYDRAILGGADVIQVLAMLGQFGETAPLTEESPAAWWSRWWSAHQLRDVSRWARGVYADVQGSVFYTRGAALHLWHGSIADRQILARQLILKGADFDPSTDIALDDSACWTWSSDKPDLHRQVKEYFWARNEQGTAAGAR